MRLIRGSSQKTTISCWLPFNTLETPVPPTSKLYYGLARARLQRKQPFVFQPRATRKQHWEEGGRGRIDNGAMYYVGWLFFLKNLGRVSKKIAHKAHKVIFGLAVFTALQIPCDTGFIKPFHNQFVVWRREPVLRTLFWWVLGLVASGFAIKLLETALWWLGQGTVWSRPRGSILSSRRHPRYMQHTLYYGLARARLQKKNNHLCFSRVQHASNIEKRGAGGGL